MERVMSPEERIRRAEEIYYRRQSQGVRVSTSSVNVGKTNKISLGRKMGIQILICVLIYSFFYVIKGHNNTFSENVINTTKSILSYDVNLGKMYNQCVEYFNNSFNNIKINITQEQRTEDNVDSDINAVLTTNELAEPQTEEQIDSSQENQQTDTSNTTVDSNQTNETTNTEESPGIGGGTDANTTIEVSVDTATQEKTQMEIDAEYVKQNCSLIIPVEGTVTSGYGNREPTEIISAFHQGIDIGAVTGTPIYASMEGTVVAASYAGDYGNHIKVQNGEVLTVYAHCSKLNVGVGDYVAQGQEIGKVGSTGKVTGPHLHFEIRRENRYIDPSMILNF